MFALVSMVARYVVRCYNIAKRNAKRTKEMTRRAAEERVARAAEGCKSDWERQAPRQKD